MELAQLEIYWKQEMYYSMHVVYIDRDDKEVPESVKSHGSKHMVKLRLGSLWPYF